MSTLTRNLSLDMTGLDVSELQRLLTAAGFPTGGIDGNFGPDTLAAVLHFQARMSLATDGVVGPITWAKLEGVQGLDQLPPVPANPYQLPAHAEEYFGATPNGAFGGVPWDKALCQTWGNTALAGLARNSLQVWPRVAGADFDEAVLFQSDADVDSDGPGGSLHEDPDWQGDTSLHWPDGTGCNSHTFFGVVVPPGLRQYGVEMGDACFVCWGGVIRAAQVYDGGPRKKIGEISEALAAALGLSSNPRGGKEVSDLCTLIFPHSGAHVAIHQSDQWELATGRFNQFTGRST